MANLKCQLDEIHNPGSRVGCGGQRGLWAFQWGVIWGGQIKVGRATLMMAEAIPWDRILDCIRRTGAGHRHPSLSIF